MGDQRNPFTVIIFSLLYLVFPVVPSDAPDKSCEQEYFITTEVDSYMSEEIVETEDDGTH